MLNALSSTLKSESDDQSRNAPPTIPSAAALCLDRSHRVRIESSEVLGNVRWSSRTKNESGVGVVRGPSRASERKSERHEREQREVRDHRREVRAAVGEELPQDRSHGRQYAQRHGCRSGSRRSHRDLARRSLQVGDPRPGRVDSGRDRTRCRPRRAVRRRRAGGCSRRPIGSRSRAACAELTQLEASTLDGSVFVVRRDGRLIAATTRSDPTVGLDLLRPQALPRQHRRAPPKSGSRATPANGSGTGDGARAGRRHLCVGRSRSWSADRLDRGLDPLPPPLADGGIERVELYADDGSMVSLRRRLARGRGAAAARRATLLALPTPMARARVSRIREAALARGRLRAPLRQAQQLLPRQVPLRRRGPTCSRRSATPSPPRSRSTSRTPSGSPRPSSAPSRSPRPPRSPRGCRS